MIINGRVAVSGLRPRDLEQGIHNQPATSGPELKSEKGYLKIAASPQRQSQAQIWWVSYTPGLIYVAIGSGENKGRTLPHRHIVRSLRLLGTYTGAALMVKLPHMIKGEASAILLQEKSGGPILNALKL